MTWPLPCSTTCCDTWPLTQLRPHDALGPAVALVGGLLGERLARGGRRAAGAVGPEAEGVVGRTQRGLDLAAAHRAVHLPAERHGRVIGAVDGQPGQRPRRLAVARERVGHRRQQAGRGAQRLARVAREAHRHEAAVRRAHHEHGRRVAVVLRDHLGDHRLEEAHVVDGGRGAGDERRARRSSGGRAPRARPPGSPRARPAWAGWSRARCPRPTACRRAAARPPAGAPRRARRAPAARGSCGRGRRPRCGAAARWRRCRARASRPRRCGRASSTTSPASALEAAPAMACGGAPRPRPMPPGRPAMASGSTSVTALTSTIACAGPIASASAPASASASTASAAAERAGGGQRTSGGFEHGCCSGGSLSNAWPSPAVDRTNLCRREARRRPGGRRRPYLTELDNDSSVAGRLLLSLTLREGV